jgi:hypothetical protein
MGISHNIYFDSSSLGASSVFDSSSFTSSLGASSVFASSSFTSSLEVL